MTVGLVTAINYIAAPTTGRGMNPRERRVSWTKTG